MPTNAIAVIETDKSLKDFIAHLCTKEVGFYAKWKAQNAQFQLPNNCVWKPYKDEEGKPILSAAEVFKIMLQEITDQLKAFNATRVAGNKIVLQNIVVVSANPWASLSDLSTAPVAEEFGGWPSKEIQADFEKFKVEANKGKEPPLDELTLRDTFKLARNITT